MVTALLTVGPGSAHKSINRVCRERQPAHLGIVAVAAAEQALHRAEQAATLLLLLHGIDAYIWTRSTLLSESSCRAPLAAFQTNETAFQSACSSTPCTDGAVRDCVP